ncbi:MAG: hypothetical protein HC892_23540 [Saprospiraceae bacterium]|nr:hypothetical protein [Saprospiraceae bacterium]
MERWSKEQLPTLHLDVPKTINFEGVEKICLLFLAANPSKTSEISWEKEHTLIAEKVRESKKCEVIPVGGVDLDAIIDAVEDRQPHVIHFCGHGKEASVTADGRPTTGGIILHDKRKGQNIVDDSVLKTPISSLQR